MITDLVDEFPIVTPDQINDILRAERTTEVHRNLAGQVPAMNAIQKGGQARAEKLTMPLTIAAWNMERCYFPQASAAHLSQIDPQIVLLSEVDHGMARTGERHTSEEMAATLGMEYIFGVEFFELGLGGPTELPYCKDKTNARGWHGNAILSAVPIKRAAMIRMIDDGYWFGIKNGSSLTSQPRLGGRMALLAVFDTVDGEICIVSTHLESHSKVERRHHEMVRILDAVDIFAPGLPVLLGGDLNSGNFMPDNDWRHETLFSLAQERGFSWDFTAKGNSTRASLITPNPRLNRKLDWIAGRDLQCRDKGLLSAISQDGTPLSDHDCAWSTVTS